MWSTTPETERRGTETRSQAAVIFEMLANDRRRYALDALADRGEPITVRRLATAVAARVADGPPSAVEAEHRRRVAVALHHKHLPKLADHGVIEYDEVRATVRLADPHPLLVTCLDAVAEYERPRD